MKNIHLYDSVFISQLLGVGFSDITLNTVSGIRVELLLIKALSRGSNYLKF